MSFGQLTHRESLSDTVMCIQANAPKLYHLGIGSAISKSTLSQANEKRDWRIYQDFAMILIGQAKKLYAGDSQLEVDIKNNVFAIDSTTIDLCLSVFPWAKFRKTKAAIKLHTMIDLKTSIPEFIHISDGRMHDLKALELITFVPDSFYVMDRGYLDFRQLYRIHTSSAFFVTRSRSIFDFEIFESKVVDKATGVQCDQTIKPRNYTPASKYPRRLRRIEYYDKEQDKTLVFLTNSFELEAGKIAMLYKHRWFIELFFKWIKQHLKVKSFWGSSPNAVKTQIWIAISVYVIVLILKKRLKLDQSIYEILQVLSINILDKEPIKQLFKRPDINNFNERFYNQLILFE
jgi:predicted transcriptional regulator